MMKHLNLFLGIGVSEGLLGPWHICVVVGVLFVLNYFRIVYIFAHVVTI